jgi:ATP-dependent RNA helicase DOB1
MLGHIDGDGVLQLKGRAACLIDTGDELLITELMFNGINSIWLSVSKFSL